MNRTVVMTLGFLLVFFGIQLNIVDSYVLTPRVATFISTKFNNDPAFQNNAINANQQLGTFNQQTGTFNQQPGPFTQAGFTTGQQNQPIGLVGAANQGVNRVIRPPGWIGWPVMFLGAVFFLNALTMRK